jgi:hypothetical protein
MTVDELAIYLEDITDSKKSPYRLAATMLRQQQAEIDALKKLKDDKNAIDKKLFESIKKSNEMWDKAAESLIRKAKK